MSPLTARVRPAGDRDPSPSLFADLGFAVLPKLLSPQRLADIAGWVDASDGDAARRSPRLGSMIPYTGGDLPLAVVAEGDAIARISRVAAATDLRWISGYAIVKSPGTRELWWHQDWWCWNRPESWLAAPTQIAVLCYLDDTTRASGALRVLPGSHRHRSALHDSLPEAHSTAADLLPDDDRCFSSDDDEVVLEVAAGDAVVLDYRLLHGTTANSRPRSRRALHMSFVPHWSSLAPELRGHLSRHPCLVRAGAIAVHVEPLLPPDGEGSADDIEICRRPPADWGGQDAAKTTWAYVSSSAT